MQINYFYNNKWNVIPTQKMKLLWTKSISGTAYHQIVFSFIFRRRHKSFNRFLVFPNSEPFCSVAIREWHKFCADIIKRRKHFIFFPFQSIFILGWICSECHLLSKRLDAICMSHRVELWAKKPSKMCYERRPNKQFPKVIRLVS